MCIHPDQCAIVEEEFGPSEQAVREALEIVGAFEQAEKGGVASIQSGGRFIDYPVYFRAQKVLSSQRPLQPNQTVKIR
jgi:citrate lyase subunit beta/citryl-CoA lyase